VAGVAESTRKWDADRRGIVGWSGLVLPMMLVLAAACPPAGGRL
jgi:hypothetical protein